MVALLGSSVAYWTTDRMGEELDRIANDAGQKLDAVGEFSTLLDRIRVSGRQVLVYGFFKKPEIVTQEIQKIEDAKPRLDSAMLRLKGLLKSSEESTIFAKAEEIMGPWYQNVVTVNQLCLAGKPEEAAASSQKNGRAVSQVFDQTRVSLLTTARNEVRTATEEAQKVRGLSHSIAILSIFLAVVVSIVVFVLIHQIGGHISRAVGEISQGVHGIHTAVAQLSSASQSLAASASEQAASIEETSASADEVSSVSRSNAGNVSEAASLVSSVNASIRHGDQSVSAMQKSMEDIASAGRGVSKIIKVIDEISFQTNILALNAAVEAARAGEAGLGFAVVADEVRNLAQRCAQAAKDTASLIEDSLEKSQRGHESVEQVNTIFSEVVNRTAKISTIVNEVKAGSDQQAVGMAQIASAVAQINQTTQTTAAHAEETAAATSEINAEADALRNAANQLKVIIG
jgi:methyl-accepting chemotaxis protein/methyl-accepting chemotaxis protein-1 (serine sensor receptor)